MFIVGTDTSTIVSLFNHNQGVCLYPETVVIAPLESTLAWLTRTDLDLTIASVDTTIMSQIVTITMSGSIEPPNPPNLAKITSPDTTFSITIKQKTCIDEPSIGAKITLPEYELTPGGTKASIATKDTIII